MNIIHDRSYIDASSLDFVQRGYAIEDLHSLRIRFEYTEEEKKANKAFADSHMMSGMHDPSVDMAQIRSNAMRPVMEALGRKFVCYQFEPDCGVDYSSDKWDLFFWCNDFYQTTGGKFSGRDYSYFTLTLSDRKVIERMYAAGERPIDIAGKIGCHVATVYTELQRGSNGELDANQRPAYNAEIAQRTVQEGFRRRGRPAAAQYERGLIMATIYERMAARIAAHGVEV